MTDLVEMVEMIETELRSVSYAELEKAMPKNWFPSTHKRIKRVGVADEELQCYWTLMERYRMSGFLPIDFFSMSEEEQIPHALEHREYQLRYEFFSAVFDLAVKFKFPNTELGYRLKMYHSWVIGKERPQFKRM